jgi:hypothetical protein
VPLYGTGHDDHVAIGFDRSRRIIGGIIAWEVGAPRPLVLGNVVDRRVARRTITGASVEDRTVWPQNRRPNFEAAATGPAMALVSIRPADMDWKKRSISLDSLKGSDHSLRSA